MYGIDPQSWKERIPVFEEAAKSYYAGEFPRNTYKGTSGKFGSYAQKGDAISMIRLRMTAGRMTKAKLAFTVDAMKKHNITRAHFTTCQAIQLHDITSPDVLVDIMTNALDVGIVTMGGGGDNPRNVMCGPLSGAEKGEYFDVMPYAEAAAEYTMNFIDMPKMPRKYKVGFSNSPKNAPHATFRDLGFVAREDGKFDVYSAGGLGPNPKFGVCVAEAVEPSKILYYCKAQYDTFCAYGNYASRAKARSRYMQDACGGPEGYKKAYNEKLENVLATESLDLPVLEPTTSAKKGDGTIEDRRVIAQKQEGLYAVQWHLAGGIVNDQQLAKVYETVADMEDVELRIAPDETVYIINLTASEAEKVIAATSDSAKTLFETSVSCIGATTCQAGVRDSQGLLRACLAAVDAAEIPDGALPQIHVSGCPSSCGTQQTGPIGFRGGMKKIDGKPQSAFLLTVDGNDYQGKEVMGKELGTILETEIPKFLVELGNKVAESGMPYTEWRKANPGVLEEIAAPYVG